MRLQNAEDPCIILISSLAKGFGAPLAMIAGSNNFVRRFNTRSQTQVHCSPPSAAAVLAAEHALAVNAALGNVLRRKLAQLVSLLKQQLSGIGMATTSGLFPVQTMKPLSSNRSQSLHNSLQHLGVHTVLSRHCRERVPCISFLLTLRHTIKDILNAGKMLTAITSNFGFIEEMGRFAHAI